jgi:hypothetical protein
MNHQASRTLQQTQTPLAPAAVLAAAKQFFARRNSIYVAYPEKEGPTYVNLRGMGGEEVVIGVAETEGGTLVNGSSYLFDQQIARFFSTLPPFPSASTEGVREAAPAAAAVPGAEGGA